MNRKSTVTILGTLLLLAGSNLQTAHASPPTDACALVTPAQVSAALGVTVGAGKYMFPSNKTLCTFDSANGKAGVEVAIVKLTLFAHEKTPLPGVKEEQAKGLGDEAHYMTTPGFPTGLSIRKGSFAFKVRTYGFPDQQAKDKEKALALKILAKL